MSTKIKTEFFCGNCGARSSKWLGRCPSCGEWNTYHEEVVMREKKGVGAIDKASNLAQKLAEIESGAERRVSSGIGELDRVLGGGIVPGSLVLVGGEPGIGKSTLMLQVALGLKNQNVLYISGEESLLQIKMRAERLGMQNDRCLILTETDTASILSQIASTNPDVVVVDSIQTLVSPNLDSSAGSISQVRECATEMQRFAKENSVPVFLVGHITKEGSLAGPKVLEHMVDTVLNFEGDHKHTYRILRAAKNRFGSTSELGIFEMLQTGLREVVNPSEILLSQRDQEVSGVTISATLEGQRPILVEAQALVSTAAYGTPQRSSNGFDSRRLNMLLAVIEKRNGIWIASKDVFLNITGGIRVEDPAIDLGVVCAVISSVHNIPVSEKTCFAAEVGLTGEIRPVNRIEQRIAEADKLGFEEIFVSKHNFKNIGRNVARIKVQAVSGLDQVFEKLFG